MAASAGESPLLLATITGLFSLFAGGTLVALVRVRADKNKVVVDASQGAVIIQTGVIKSLQGELARMQSELDKRDMRERELRDKYVADVAKLQVEVDRCGSEIDKLRGEIYVLTHPKT